MVILTRCSACGHSNSHKHSEGIYDVEITKVQSKDGDFILKGKTDAPDGSKILAQGTYTKLDNEASAVDDNYSKVSDHKFTMQLDTNDSTKDEIKRGLKIKVKIFAIEKYSISFKDYYLTKKVRKIITKEIDPVTLTVDSKLADYYIDDEDDSDETDDSDSDDSDNDSADTENEKSDAKSEDKSETKAEDKETSKSDNSDAASENDKSQSNDDSSSKNADNTEGTTDNSSQTQDGKVYTGNSNKIIGNARTRKYHVPGQAGYNMNSENAVYFDSEEEAQAAGFVRSKR